MQTVGQIFKLAFGFIADLFRELDAFGRFWLAVGLVVLVVAARMSYKFGADVSPEHAHFLAALTVVAAFGPMAAEMLWTKGRKMPSIATAIVCVPLLGIEFYSHAGYTAGLRGTNIETATVQNTRYDAANDAVTDDKANVAMWRQQLATLMEQNAWAATVKADGLRAEFKTLQDRIEQERNGKRGRKAGCGQECERLQNAANALGARIATVEQAEDLTKRIEATQRVLDGKREVAAKVEHKSSAVAHQNESLKRWVALAVNGDTKATELQGAAAQESASLAMAVAGTGLPAFALFLAGLFRLSRRDDDPSAPAVVTDITPPREGKYPVLAGIPSEPQHIHTTETVHIKDATLRKWALSDEVRALMGATQLKAA